MHSDGVRCVGGGVDDHGMLLSRVLGLTKESSSDLAGLVAE